MKNGLRWIVVACDSCHECFEIRRCYFERSPLGRRFCSRKCRSAGYRDGGNPKASAFAKKYGTQKAAHERQYRFNTNLRRKALDRVAAAHSTQIVCEGCGCDDYRMLQINHIQGGGFVKRESGNRLFRVVLQTPEVNLVTLFDLRCVLCNWKHFVERKYGHLYKLTWLGRPA